MIVLIIKGTRFEASQAVTERGIVVFARPSVAVGSNTWRIDTPDSEAEKIAHWFCEPSECEPGIGYPAGTLLLYSYHSENERG